MFSKEFPMGLQTKLFRNDPRLEAAAVSDPAHIKIGASGDHVRKIQIALVLLDNAVISANEMQQASFLTSTALAVLTYKTKRNIVNRSYQTQADNIVGKMTMASLDRELLKLEAAPSAPIKIQSLSGSRVLPPRSLAVVAFLKDPLNSASDSSLVGAPKILPNTILEMRRNSVAKVVVTDGQFGDISVKDPTIVKIGPDAPIPPGEKAPILDNSQTFQVFSGRTLGRTTITASTAFFQDGGSASIDVVVHTFFGPPNFTEGVNHGHKPSGRYADVRANPNSGLAEEFACTTLSSTPEGLVALARRFMFTDKPIATKHLDWYLTDGKGADFVEDDNIKDWLTRDSGIKSRLKREIAKARRTGEGHFFFDQEEYAKDTAGQDFKFAFGAIDRVDFQVNFSQDTVRVFFKDRYEWHPVYPFYDFQKGDGVRETNCVHAALVELKSSGAADFWMKGQAEVALSAIVAP
jgi:hypothetical protein